MLKKKFNQHLTRQKSIPIGLCPQNTCMKLLFLCKRRPQGRDLLTSPYGRFYHLPRLLARKGHEVTILLCSYKWEPNEGGICDDDGIHWHSVSLLNGNPWRYYRKVLQLVLEIHPDWIVGFSDTYYGMLAQHLAQKFGCKSLIDAYDNYESYIPWCRPLHYLWRRALSTADVVTVAGPSLAELIGESRKEKYIKVVPMAADPIGFVPMDALDCRKKIGLPVDKKLIGYCGALHQNRGISLLFEAFKELHQKNKQLELVLSGRKFPGISIPEGARWLGFLPDEKVPFLLNSMNVLAVINKNSKFGNYSYPVKLYEAMSCQVPVVASSSDSVRWILKDFPELQAAPEDKSDLSEKLLNALERGRVDYGRQQGWDNEGVLFERALE